MSRVLNPKLFGVRASMLLHLYRRRLRSHLAQELLAGGGIAVGVALVLGVLVANSSLTSSAGDLLDQVIGSARLELTARSPAGFQQGVAGAVARAPGVSASAAVLRENVSVQGSKHKMPVQLLGISPDFARLGSPVTKDFGTDGFRFSGGLVLPISVASAIGVQPGEKVTLLAAGLARRVTVGAVLGGSLFGALSSSPVAVTLLPVAQNLTALPGRVTQILIEPVPGRDRQVARELRGIAGGRLNVGPADQELRLLEQAIEPNSQSTELFTAISVMVGFLLALSAMLLTVPERRRFVADLRIQGYDRRQVLLLLLFQALALGVVASLVGVALGEALSSEFFHRVPDYLATAFPIGSEQVVHTGTVLAAFACGVFATVLASLTPALDLRASKTVDAVFRESGGQGEAMNGQATRRLALAGLISIVVLTAVVLAAPGLTILGGVALAVSTLLLIPAIFAAVARGLPLLGERIASSSLVVAISELRATSMRAIALAGVAGLAVYGSIAIGGAQADLLRGIDRATTQYFATADLWVGTGNDIFNVNRFASGDAAAKIARVRGVSSVRAYQGGLLDVGHRRLWIRGRPAEDPAMLESSQLLAGDLAQATRRLRAGGWAAISAGFAEEHGLAVGRRFTLPTPAGEAQFRVAAIMTNSGWPPGAITINSADYTHDWQTGDPTALEISLQPGADLATAASAVRRALADRPGLSVRTRQERDLKSERSARQGLQTLSEISTLLLVAAGLAIAAALSAAVWQRRTRLASLKIQGYATGQLWRALLLESTITVGVGCFVGALVGVYGHALAGRWLKLATGFPAPFSVAPLQMAATLVLITAVTLSVIALPGLLAARVPAGASFRD
ncbi:MAG TPA: FtsX-like permease family protein [Solirubrobacteraceae bacterium]|nr:FtsX-like permease family protein [Solirubrobacteraceae bacterium]